MNSPAVIKWPLMRPVTFTRMESPIGTLMLAADDNGLLQINFPQNGKPAPDWQEDSPAFAEVLRQLRAYFAGELENFDLPLAPEGTAFQKKVWDELCQIPYPNRDPLSSRDRQQRQADRLRRRPANQRKAPGTRKTSAPPALENQKKINHVERRACRPSVLCQKSFPSRKFVIPTEVEEPAFPPPDQRQRFAIKSQQTKSTHLLTCPSPCPPRRQLARRSRTIAS